MKKTILLILVLVPSLFFAAGQRSNRLAVGPGLMLMGGGAGLGVNVNLDFPLAGHQPVYIGAQSGIYLGGSSYGFLSSSYITLPMLASIEYDFPVAGSIRPYAAASLGFTWITESYSRLGSVSTLAFTFLLRPGMFLPLASKTVLQIETGFGVMGSTFTFLPHVNWIWYW